MIFNFDFILVSFIDSSFIFGDLRRRHRDLRRRDRRRRRRDLRHHRDSFRRRHRVLRHRDSFRRLPCYDRLYCCWLARSFRHRRHQILLRHEKRN